MALHKYSNSSDLDSDIAESLHPTIDEEDNTDLVMSFDGEGAGVYSPPAHIAARIYKSRNYNRKSSAASSRRNSIASHHSSRSGISAHGGPQSTHVAQHLRRASIIETRRAKAADRNAHAEKVRLRAALNKAAPRGPVVSEEKAMAAQQAREKYLAQVRANCAAEVQRSKRIAEEQRERKAAEYMKMKADMAERHAQAEKRRALLEQSQRRPRTAQSASDEAATEKRRGYVWKPRNELEAAMILQHVWKRRQHKSVIQAFLGLGLTVESARNSSFEDVGERLNQEDVILKTTRLLRLFNLTSGSGDLTQEQSTVKTFLSCFLILGQPDQVLSRNTDQEKAVISKSQDLLVALNHALELPYGRTSTEDKNIYAGLSQAHDSFKEAFAAWRSHDSAHMITHIVAQFVELDAIWQNVKDDTAGEVTEDYKEGIRNNQALVITRLKKLAGPERAMRLIKEGLKKSRKARAQKKQATVNIPRIASDTESSASKLAAAEPSISSDKISTSPKDRHSASQRLQSTSLVPDSRVVVHELAINKQWTIDVEQREAQRDEIINSTAKHLQDGLDAGLAGIWIPALAEALLQKLSNLLPPEKPTYAMVKDVLDPSMVAQQVQNGTFSYQNFFNFMNSMLPKLCAPVRDEEVKNLAQQPSEDPVKQMARIYFIVELMVLDMLNFQLIGLSPTLLKESVGYESRAFEKSLDGAYPQRTHDWWKQASVFAQEEAAKRSPESRPQLSLSRIYAHGLADLAIAIDPLPSASLPETLELDHQRLVRMRSDVLRIITISSILLNAKNLLRRDTRSLWKAEAVRMWELPFSASPNVYVSIVESRYALPPATKQQLTTFITRVLGEAREGHANHPVMKVLLKKIKSFVLTRLLASSEEERTRLASTATEVLGTAGMMEFVSRIGDMFNELQRVGEVDREAHSRWYDRVVEKVASEDESGSG